MTISCNIVLGAGRQQPLESLESFGRMLSWKLRFFEAGTGHESTLALMPDVPFTRAEYVQANKALNAIPHEPHAIEDQQFPSIHILTCYRNN
jgi:hypothetical protein